METNSLLYCTRQFLIKQLITVVGWEVNTVEAGERGRAGVTQGQWCWIELTYHVWALGSCSVEVLPAELPQCEQVP